jgi:undecaprenyl-diphosphatase
MSDNDAVILESEPRVGRFHRPLFVARRSRQAGWLVAAAVGALAVLGLLAHFFIPYNWDVEMTRAVQAFSLPGLKGLLVAVSGFGNAPKFAAMTALALLACNKRSEAFWLTWSGLGGWFLSMQLKHLLARPRPTADVVEVFHQWETASFPSGHVVFYICFFGFLFFIARERLPRGSFVQRLVLIMTALPVVLVGFARVYLGEHWPSDMPGSYILGGLWLALSLKLFRLWRNALEEPTLR